MRTTPLRAAPVPAVPPLPGWLGEGQLGPGQLVPLPPVLPVPPVPTHLAGATAEGDEPATVQPAGVEPEVDGVDEVTEVRVRPLRAPSSRPSRRTRRIGVAGVTIAAALLWVLTAVTLGTGSVPNEPADLVAAVTSTTASSSTTTSTTATTVPPSTTEAVTVPTVAATAPPAPVVTSPPTTAAPRTRTTLPGASPPSGGTRTAAVPASVPVIGRISIPSLGLHTTLFEGGDLAQIDHGPSHMPTTVMPGRQGNTVVAGHRTTKTHPFRDLDLLSPGDTVSFEMSYGTYSYEFTHHTIVTEDDVYILNQGSGYEATLFACHPKGSSEYRIVAHFRLIGTPAAPPTTAAPPVTTPKVGTLPGR